MAIPVDSTRKKITINDEICFSDAKGRIKEGIKKKKLKLLDPFSQLLSHTIQPGEEILIVTTALSPTSTLEFLTTGKIIYYVKRCVLIITNMRILHIPTTPGYKPKSSFSQIYLGDIERSKVSGSINSSLSLTYKNGKKETFRYLRRADAKKLKEFLSTPEQGLQPTPARGRAVVCPRCNEPLQKDHYSCRGCRLEFKNPSKAMRLSVLIPGGGYFYTGHPILGLMDFVIETGLIVAVLTSVVLSTSGQPDWESIIVFGVLLAFEKLITIYHADHYVKEYIPAEKDFVPFVGMRLI